MSYAPVGFWLSSARLPQQTRTTRVRPQRPGGSPHYDPLPQGAAGTARQRRPHSAGLRRSTAAVVGLGPWRDLDVAGCGTLVPTEGHQLATARAHDADFWTQDKDFGGIEGVRYKAARKRLSAHTRWIACRLRTIAFPCRPPPIRSRFYKRDLIALVERLQADERTNS